MKKNGQYLQLFLYVIVFSAAIPFFSCTPRSKLSRRNVEATTGIDLAAFNRNLKIARELAIDDKIAWISTDSILSRKFSHLDSLDSTWFVCKYDNRRFAYYGRYDEEKEQYYPKYAFVSTDDSTISKLPSDTGDTGDIASFYAKMVTAGSHHFKTVVDSLQLDIHYNHYIRTAPDGNCTMWFLPAGYRNYCAQGIEVRITIDKVSGTVTGHSVAGSLLHYFEIDKPSKPVELDNSWSATPSVGNIFFVLRNRDTFDTIRIRNRHSVSSLEYTDDGTWRWVHTAR